MKNLLLLLSLLFLAPSLAKAQCGTPTGFSSSGVTDFTATVSWTPVPGALWYAIQYRVAAGPGAWINSSSTPATKPFVGLTPATTYDVRVKAYCSGSSSPYSAIFQFTTTNNCIYPGGINATGITTTTASVNWTAVAPANYYTLRYRTTAGPGAWVTGTVVPTTKALTGLTPGTMYDVQIATNCTGGQSAFSPTFNFMTKCASLSVVTVSGTYSKTLNQGDGTTILYSDSSVCTLLATITDSVGGNTMGSTAVTATVTPSVQTGIDPYYIFGRRGINISPSSTGSGTITFYYDQSDFTNYNANNPTFLDLPVSGSNSDPNISHFRMARVLGSNITYSAPIITWNASRNRWECVINSSDVKATYYFYTMPDCIGVNVSGLTPTLVTGTTVTPTWTQVTTPAYGWYSLQYSELGSGIWTSGGTSNNGTSSKYLIGLTPNTNYEIQIRRHCSSQSAGDWSASEYFMTLNTCNTPTGVNMLNITGTSATIDWTAVTGASYYTTRYREASGPGPWITGTVGSNSKNISGLTTSTTYDVEVATNCPGYLSDYSTTIQFTTLASRPAAVNTLEEGNDISIYPNPARENLNVNLTLREAQEVVVKMMDISGRELKQIHAHAVAGQNALTLDVSNLANGLYNVQVYYNGKLSYVSNVLKN
ncbi:MAG: fibronectin type III domain-containing protein [Chitinophagaceae bacterium]|nr:fibronectin type III domain-containing protein [Chitinophagaceae bacterium]